MKKLSKALMYFCAFIALFLLGTLIFGIVTKSFADGNGMSAIFFMLYAVIFAVLTIALAFANHLLGKKQTPPNTQGAKLGFISGILVLVVIAVLIAMDVQL